MIITQLFVFVALLLLIFYLGHAFISLFYPPLFKNRPFESVFGKLLIGFLLSLILFALVKSQFQSVLIVLVPPALIVFYAKRKSIPAIGIQRIYSPKATEWKVLALLFGLSIPLLAWKNYGLYHADLPFPIVINSDSIYHTNISLFLQEFGLEHLSCNRIFLPDGTYPYHYFESWSIAFINSIFNFNPWFITECITHPFLALMVASSMLALFSHFRVINAFTVLLAATSIIFTGLFFPSLAQNFWLLNYQGTNAYEYNALDEFWGLKLVVAYLFTATSLFFVAKRQLALSILFLLALPVASITLAPVVIVASLVYLASEFWLLKKYSKKELKLSLMVWLMVSGGIISFYKITGSTVEYIAIPDYKLYIARLFTLQQLKINISYFTVRSGQALFVYSPIILLVGTGFLGKKKQELRSLLSPWKGVGILVLFVYLGAMALWLFVEGSFGSKTYYFYSVLPFFNLISVLLLGIVSIHVLPKRLKTLVISCYLIALTYYVNRTHNIYTKDFEERWEKYDTNYMREIYALKDEIKGFKGGKLEDIGQFSSIYNDNLDPLGFFILGFFNNNSDFKGLTSLSVLHADTTELSGLLNIGYIKSMPLFQYASHQWTHDSSLPKEELQGKFIVENNIRYIVADPSAPDLQRLNRWAKKTIVDPKSNVHFILLDFNKIPY